LDGCIKDLFEINLGTSSYRIFGVETVVFVGKFKGKSVKLLNLVLVCPHCKHGFRFSLV
jgi:hypothetical protein